MVLLLFTLFCWFLSPCLLNVHTSLQSSPLIYPGDHRPSSLLSLRGIANGMCLVNKLLTSASSKCLHVRPSFYHLMQFLLSRLQRYSLVWLTGYSQTLHEIHQEILLALTLQFIQSLTFAPFLHCCHHHLLLGLVQEPPNWSPALPLCS